MRYASTNLIEFGRRTDEKKINISKKVAVLNTLKKFHGIILSELVFFYYNSIKNNLERMGNVHPSFPHRTTMFFIAHCCMDENVFVE